MTLGQHPFGRDEWFLIAVNRPLAAPRLIDALIKAILVGRNCAPSREMRPEKGSESCEPKTWSKFFHRGGKNTVWICSGGVNTLASQLGITKKHLCQFSIRRALGRRRHNDRNSVDSKVPLDISVDVTQARYAQSTQSEVFGRPPVERGKIPARQAMKSGRRELHPYPTESKGLFRMHLC
jgi:hypothetical protein